MDYNTYFNRYQNQYTNQYSNPYQTNYNGQNGLHWVQGEASAKAWLIAPNTSVLLMDSESQRFYIKSADASGMPTMRTFEYNELKAETSPLAHSMGNGGDFITRAELNELNGKIEALERRLNNESNISVNESE